MGKADPGHFFGVRTWSCVFLLLGLSVASSHPFLAGEANYPLVPGFERFFLDQDAPDYLAQGGLLLLNELNCVGCHAPGPGWREKLPGVKGPDLAGVGSRVRDLAVLQLMIRNPRVLKRATVMPSLFAASDRDEDGLDALLHYLASLKEPSPQPMLLGEVEQGRRLYHEVGCAACHDPDIAYLPPGWPPGQPMEKPGIASHTIRWAEYWTSDFVTRFLLEPPRFHPGRRMPGMGLREEEAAHLTAYLQDWGPPGANDLAAFVSDALRLDRGGFLFRTKGCAVCHEVSGARLQSRNAGPGLDALAALEGGCLAAEPPAGGVPFFFLSELQKRALRGAIERIRGREAGEEGMGPAIEDVLTRMDCYACHTYRGKGGPELPREPYFGALDPRAADRDDWLPPPLDHLERGTRSKVRKTSNCGKIPGLPFPF